MTDPTDTIKARELDPSADRDASDGQKPAELPSFSTLDLPSTVMQGIRDAGFAAMTPVQKESLPVALSGKDLCAQAQTGTGKTAAFLIALFTQILDRETSKKRRGPLALVLAPTRELAVQIHKEGEMLGRHTSLHQLAVYGGEGFKRQEEGLKRKPHIVVGTPGRLIDFARRRILDLSEVQFLVIDEADRLLDLGFWDELRDILRRLPEAKKRQSLLFSATLDRRTRSIAREFMNRPRDIAIAPEQITAEGIDQVVYHVDRDEKFRLLLGILGREEITKGLIFTNMKITAAWLVKKLKEHGFEEIGLLTGDLRQSVRNRVLERFKGNRLPLLVASDVASRGLHIDDVTHIINYDVPQDPEDYVHRIGRTARAGKRGKAYTLACDQYVYSLPAIEELLGAPVPSEVPFEEDYGKDLSPEYTVDTMMNEVRRERRKQRQGQKDRGRRPERKRRRPRGKGPRR